MWLLTLHDVQKDDTSRPDKQGCELCLLPTMPEPRQREPRRSGPPLPVLQPCPLSRCPSERSTQAHSGPCARHNDHGSLDYSRFSARSYHAWRTRADELKTPLRAGPAPGNLLAGQETPWRAPSGGAHWLWWRGWAPVLLLRPCLPLLTTPGHPWDPEGTTQPPSLREQSPPGTGRAPEPGSVTAG